MLRNLLRFLLFIAVFAATSSAFARRGNPISSVYITSASHIIDSDDNHPLKPTYKFVDTLYWADHLQDKDKWKRVTFTNTDDGYGNLGTVTDSFQMNFMGNNRRMPPDGILGSIGVNGVVCIDTAAAGPNNSAFGIGPIRGAVAALWTDMELRTTGDSSKVFYRTRADSCYITYYNLALKGTHGKVRATFQIVFATPDSSVQINYRSFDGEYCGEPAAKIFQRLATIGAQSPNSQTWTNYLDRGLYYAVSFGSSLYAQDLHNQLAVKFLRMPDNRIRLRSIANPASQWYETSDAQFVPQVKVDNLYTDSVRVRVNNVITNLATNQTIYNRTADFTIFPYQFTTLSTPEIGLSCGSYRLKSTVTFLGFATWIGTVTGTDPWPEDNVSTLDFKRYNNTPAGEFPNFDDFATLDRCEYIFKGITKDSAHLLFYDPPHMASSSALIFDRNDEVGVRYPRPGQGDTLISGPFNLSTLSSTAKNNTWLQFSYQRGRRTDSSQAGIFLRTLSGPDPLRTNGSGGVLRGDSLVIEVSPSTAAVLNPTEASWVAIGKIYGGLDYETKKFRIQIPSAYVHSHTRFRIRYASSDQQSRLCTPYDDNDAFIVDELQINAPEFGRKNETDIEVLSLDLGNGPYTHIPRSVKNIVPKVRLGSNGMQVNSAFYVVKLIIRDALNREVYHRTQTFTSPGPRRDTVIPMPMWNIEGSQGGKFTARAYIELSPNEYRRLNDTALFTRVMHIDDMYAFDDNQHDTAGKMVLADGTFKLTFTPLVPDEIRGFAMYHATATGLSNWSITFRRPGGPLAASRSFSYNADAPGWWRSTFEPFMLATGAWEIQVQLTQGISVNGDASRGLVWIASDNGTAKTYTALYPNILSNFADAGGAPYYSASAVKNDTSFGPLLPMVRMIFTGSSTYLPVELLSFTAQRMMQGNVRLDFRTATEENVRSFEIERQHGTEWIPVNAVTATNSRNGAAYKSVDVNAPQERTTYRLWGIDLDGSRNMLGTAEAGPSSAVRELSIVCIPNPAREKFRLQLDGASFDGSTAVTIFDALGKNVLSMSDLRTAATDIDTRNLVPGTYFVEVTDGARRVRTTIVVTQ